MQLMGSPGVFFTKRYYLIIKADVLRRPLDDHGIVYLSCICLPRLVRFLQTLVLQ